MFRSSAFFLACFLTLMLALSCATDLGSRKQQAEASRRLGEGYLAEGNATAALAELLKAEELYDKDHFLHYDLGVAYFKKGESELAISHFKKAIELKPDYAEAYNYLGLVYCELRHWDKAIAAFNKARSNLLYATPHIVLNNLGEAYRKQKDYDRAIQYYKEAIDAEPRFPNAHRGLGLTYMDMGNYEDAVDSLQKAVQYAPRFALAHFDLGEAYTLLFETDKAIHAFKNVVTLVPDSPLAERASAEIRKLQD